MATGIDDEFEIWNGTALTKAVWFFQHLRLLPERRKAFVQLCRTGTAYTDKGSKIAVYHPEHAREYLNDELTVGSLEEPFAGLRGSWGAIAATPEAPAAAPFPRYRQRLHRQPQTRRQANRERPEAALRRPQASQSPS